MRILSLFDGISVGQLAISSIIKDYEYFSSEIDKFALSITNKHFPNTIQLGDVNNINFNDFKDIDLLIGGSPCQNFSKLGSRKGFEGTSGLFYKYIEALNIINPKYFLFENVTMKKEWVDIINNSLSTQPIRINSNLVSAQNRNRLYWTNIKDIEQPKNRHIYLKDIMLKESQSFTYPTESALKFIKQKYERGWISKLYSDENTKKSDCLLASMYKNKQSFVYKQNDILRYYHPIECELLQTLPMNYTEGLSVTQRYKSVGNSWTLEVIKHILSYLN